MQGPSSRGPGQAGPNLLSPALPSAFHSLSSYSQSRSPTPPPNTSNPASTWPVQPYQTRHLAVPLKRMTKIHPIIVSLKGKVIRLDATQTILDEFLPICLDQSVLTRRGLLQVLRVPKRVECILRLNVYLIYLALLLMFEARVLESQDDSKAKLAIYHPSSTENLGIRSTRLIRTH